MNTFLTLTSPDASERVPLGVTCKSARNGPNSVIWVHDILGHFLTHPSKLAIVFGAPCPTAAGTLNMVIAANKSHISTGERVLLVTGNDKKVAWIIHEQGRIQGNPLFHVQLSEGGPLELIFLPKNDAQAHAALASLEPDATPGTD